jgi:hypothetical protein
LIPRDRVGTNIFHKIWHPLIEYIHIYQHSFDK